MFNSSYNGSPHATAEQHSPSLKRMMSKADSTMMVHPQRSLVSKRSGSNMSISFLLPKKDSDHNVVGVENADKEESSRKTPRRKPTGYPQDVNSSEAKDLPGNSSA